jgi:hypothetical protein
MDCRFESPSAFATEAEVRHSTVFDVLSGRRDASEQLLATMADRLDVPVEALSTDPYGVVPPLLKVAASARRLAPELNGHDFGLRRALADLEEVGL